MREQTTIVVIGSLRVKFVINVMCLVFVYMSMGNFCSHVENGQNKS